VLIKLFIRPLFRWDLQGGIYDRTRGNRRNWYHLLAHAYSSLQFLMDLCLSVRDSSGCKTKSNYLCPGSWHGRMDSATSQPLPVTTRAQLLLPPPPPPPPTRRSVLLPGRRPPRACSLSSSSRCPTTSTTTVKGTYLAVNNTTVVY
jgi:hypothetical protein